MVVDISHIVHFLPFPPNQHRARSLHMNNWRAGAEVDTYHLLLPDQSDIYIFLHTFFQHCLLHGRKLLSKCKNFVPEAKSSENCNKFPALCSRSLTWVYLQSFYPKPKWCVPITLLVTFLRLWEVWPQIQVPNMSADVDSRQGSFQYSIHTGILTLLVIFFT